MSNEKAKVVRTIQGEVVSDKADKTITVQVTRRVKHPALGKYIKRKTTVHAHDEDNVCKIGDLVLIKESRPISKLKKWLLVKVLQKAE